MLFQVLSVSMHQRPPAPTRGRGVQDSAPTRVATATRSAVSAPPAPTRPAPRACPTPAAAAAASATTGRRGPVLPCPRPARATHPRGLRFPWVHCCDQRTLRQVQNRTSASIPPLVNDLKLPNPAPPILSVPPCQFMLSDTSVA